MGKIRVFRYRWQTRYLPRLLRWTICAARGHKLGQVELLCFNGWPFHRPCKRCGVQVGCRYESLRGICEYEPGYRHDGRRGLDMLIEEAEVAQRPTPEAGGGSHE